jgi:hypothetical protein
MQPVAAEFIAAPLHVMITKPGENAAERWTVLTTNLIATAGFEAVNDPARFEQIKALRKQIALELLPAFNSLKPNTTMFAVTDLAKVVAQNIAAIAKPTPWGDNFAHPQIIAAIEDVIRRNLNSAADCLR